ncbi:MAG: hypothetical protein DRI46_08090 [Chloroflexi bacterium]|nr:MAG: hypothetical protein DRI46_08090 [Chloroflexota bacterium]
MNQINKEVMAALKEEAPNMMEDDIFLRMLLITFHGVLQGTAELYFMDNQYISRFIPEDDDEFSMNDVPQGAEPAEPKDYYVDLIHPRLMAGIRRGTWMVVDTDSGPTVTPQAIMEDMDYFKVMPSKAAIEFIKSTVNEL